MQTPKEIFLELLQPDGHPERILKQYEALHMCLNDPINTYLRGNRRRGTVSRDRWGTTISFPEDAPGAIPVHTDDLTVCPDVTRWEETVHAPDLAANCTQGWEACRTAAHSAAGEEKLLAGFMGTGIFEQCHFLMGFENTLTALYEHPEEMHRLIDYITDYRLGYVKLLIDNLHPDVIFSHDDWGTKDALFMHPDMWREPRRLLPGAHCGRHGRDRHPGLAGGPAGKRHPRSPAAPGGQIGAHGRHRRSHRPRRRHAGGDTLLHRGHPVCLCARGPLHPLHHLRPPRRRLSSYRPVYR